MSDENFALGAGEIIFGQVADRFEKRGATLVVEVVAVVVSEDEKLYLIV